jgi:hypothetical protein
LSSQLWGALAIDIYSTGKYFVMRTFCVSKCKYCSFKCKNLISQPFLASIRIYIITTFNKYDITSQLPFLFITPPSGKVKMLQMLFLFIIVACNFQLTSSLTHWVNFGGKKDPQNTNSNPPTISRHFCMKWTNNFRNSFPYNQTQNYSL